MSNDLNQCNFIGKLGKAPELKFMQDGKGVCKFSLAIGSQWKNKNGEKQESVEWVNIVVFDKLAEICAEYLVKGSSVFISGKIKTSKYTDKQGIERYSTDIVANQMQMLGDKKKSDAPPADNFSTPKPQARPPLTTADPFAPPPKDPFDDEIPFN